MSISSLVRNSFMALVAILSASALGYPYIPDEIKGNAMELSFLLFAKFKDDI